MRNHRPVNEMNHFQRKTKLNFSLNLLHNSNYSDFFIYRYPYMKRPLITVLNLIDSHAMGCYLKNIVLNLSSRRETKCIFWLKRSLKYV